MGGRILNNMRIKKVRLQNFRIHADSTLDCGDASFVCIRGKNFSGKTSIGEGISLALTPTTIGLDDQGRGFAKKIKRGEAKAIISVDVQGKNHVVRRTVTLNTNTTGRTQESECLDDPDFRPFPFDKLLENQRAALSVALNTRAFLAMIDANDEKKQKNLIAKLVLPSHYDFPKDIVESVNKYLGEGAINFDGEPFSVIQTAYKKLFDERQTVNRQVKEFSIPDPLPVPGGVNSSSLHAQLTSLRAARQKWSEERDAAVKKANEGEIRKVRLNARIETLEHTIESSKSILHGLQRNILAPSVLKAHEEKAGAQQHREQLRKDQASVRVAMLGKKAELARFEEIPDAGTICPTCDQTIDSDKLGKLSVRVQGEYNMLRVEEDRIAKEIMAIGDVDAAVLALNTHSLATKEQTAAEQKIADSTAFLNESRASLDKEVTPPFDFGPFDKTLEETDAAITKIMEQLRPVIAAEERVKEIGVKKDQLARLQAKASSLDALVKKFDKDGIKAELIAQYIGGFENKANELMGGWGYKCSLSIDPYELSVINQHGDAIEVAEISGAERLMFVSAFQCAVSRMAGIGFVIIDMVDTLLPELRPSLYRNLYETVERGELDQVILLVADTSETVPKLHGATFFMVDDGTVRRLG